MVAGNVHCRLRTCMPSFCCAADQDGQDAVLCRTPWTECIAAWNWPGPSRRTRSLNLASSSPLCFTGVALQSVALSALMATQHHVTVMLCDCMKKISAVQLCCGCIAFSPL